jgi:adenosylmethionine-8-amino-7-oxononanoate aminotransferase
MQTLAVLDHRHVWHPFTQMRDWLKTEPLVIVRGRGAELQDARGRRYLDANSSIWTNLHGHGHPRINAAIRRQLSRIAHSSALGLANEPASILAEALVKVANPPTLTLTNRAAAAKSSLSSTPAKSRLLTKVFFSDNGSTAVEVALKLCFEFAKRTGESRRPRFLGLEGAYHGDTVGAVSLGHIDLFHKSYAPLLFRSDKVMAPYCYRCRFNRARPERADAREYRKCNWECLGLLESKLKSHGAARGPYAGFLVEPLMQGAAGMIPQPPGWLRRACELARGYGSSIIADEVMTGFGRTGLAQASGQALPPGRVEPRRRTSSDAAQHSLFACHHEGVQPDFIALAKGLTGGYLPMAATLTNERVFEAFLGEYDEFKTFFHGHSYTGNQLGSAAALASLQILEEPASIAARRRLQQVLSEQLGQLWRHPNVGDIRQVGLVVGVELVRDWRTRAPFELRERVGIRVCEAMARRGVLTRPIGNVVPLIPPYCTSERQARRIVETLSLSIEEILPANRPQARRSSGKSPYPSPLTRKL